MSNNCVRGLTSIIIPCWNQLEFTRQCIRSLVRHTRPAWELITSNNASTDGTGHYLAGLHDAAPVPVTVIANSANRVFRPRSTLCGANRYGEHETDGRAQSSYQSNPTAMHVHRSVSHREDAKSATGGHNQEDAGGDRADS